MTPSLPRALVFMTARNCERYVRAALDSLVWQTHPAVHVLFVDDASEDATAAIAAALLAEHFEGRHTLVRNPQPWGKARSAHVHLRAALPHGDFVAIVDADDQLILADALSLLAQQYQDGFDVVWTNYVTDQGGQGGNLPLDAFQSPRGQGWRTSHCFSFRAELLETVPQDYFQDERGEWLTAACDFAIAYPVLDQTRRYKHLPIAAYRYTATNPQSHHNRDAQARGLSSRHQMASARQVLAKPALPCRHWVMGAGAPADEAMSQLQRRLQAPPGAAAPAPALVQPARLAVEPPTAQQLWQQAAIQQIAQRCPAWVALAMDRDGLPLDVAQSWQWWQWLQTGRSVPRVLEIGGGALAAPLHAAVRALGGHIVSACPDRERAVALYARLRSALVESEVLHVPMIEIDHDGVTGRFPDLRALPADDGPFDIVVITARDSGVSGDDTFFALPCVAERLDPEGFRLCLWAPDAPELRRRMAQRWSALAPDLQCSPDAFGGHALCVHSS